MKLRPLLLGAFLICHAGWAAEQPRPGQRVDLAVFGHARTWDGNPGIEWDEPRDVGQVEVEFANTNSVPPPKGLRLEYSISSWPPRWIGVRGGWTKTDTPGKGNAHGDDHRSHLG